MSNTRIERDSMGELQVPAEALYGAQTQRAVNNFPVSQQRMPTQFIRALLLAKAAAMQSFRDRYETLKQGWGGFAGYDAWFANANNASLGVLAAYTDLVGDFERLFVQQASLLGGHRAHPCRHLEPLPLAQLHVVVQQQGHQQRHDRLPTRG